MLVTREARWFFDTRPSCWASPHGEPEIRTDWYAPLADGASSVKLRSGRLEAKLRTDEGGPSLVSRWVKFSVAADDGERANFRRVAERRWIGVKKQRELRHYDAPSGETLDDPAADSSVQVEWSEVRLLGDPATAWSLSLEAPDTVDPEALLGLLRVLQEKGLAPRELPAPESYPEWLRRRAVMNLAGGPATRESPAAPDHPSHVLPH
ncbi:hypothetical protein [Botrimarina sp.]|uniref:hypothetical protein n=1 Tax=Botrimarina sp. TaxID=2795802 RepID=UPI0032EBD509